jgi:hypothetical protein
MDTFLLTDWQTVRGNVTSSVTQITQEQDQWLDLTPYSSAFFWLDCRGFTTGSGTVKLTIDTAPCLDEELFTALVGPVTLVASQTPVLLYAGVPGVSILARYVRWRLTSNAVSGAWDATFRIWAGAAVPGM